MERPIGEPKNEITNEQIKELHNFDCEINDSSSNAQNNNIPSISVNPISGWGDIHNSHDQFIAQRDMLLEQVAHLNRLIDAHYKDENSTYVITNDDIEDYLDRHYSESD